MLLRSITKHVKDQNWFAVVLDFMIVVLGILIAFQITNWNEARSFAEKERLIIARLTSDFKAQEEQLVERTTRGLRLYSETGELVALIKQGDAPTDRERVKQLILAAFSTSFEISPPASYQELVGTGGFSELSSIPLRDALVEYGQTNAKWRYVMGNSQAQISEHSLFRQAITVDFATDSSQAIEDRVDPVSMDYDWDKLKMAEISVSTIVQMHRSQHDRHRLDLQAVRQVLIALNETTK